MPSQIPHIHHDNIDENGFTIIRNFLSDEEVRSYKKVAQEIVEYARQGKWEHVRTRGKQFPPWPKDFTPDIWGVSALLHPDLGERSYPLHDLYASEKMMAIVIDILQTNPDNVSMELLNMLINPLTDFDLEWHRDDIKPEVSPEEELSQLNVPYSGCQFNLALEEDECLIVIPGSHKRIRTEEERQKTTDDSKKKPISGQIPVALHPGDVVFYNSNILHRGVYDSKNPRLTFHGSYGHMDFGKNRARLVLQHGVANWLPRLEPRNETLAQLKIGLEKMASENFDNNMGFSLSG